MAMLATNLMEIFNKNLDAIREPCLLEFDLVLPFNMVDWPSCDS
jgi:hypothetical protein